MDVVEGKTRVTTLGTQEVYRTAEDGRVCGSGIQRNNLQEKVQLTDRAHHHESEPFRQFEKHKSGTTKREP